jgi:hypothetical protein
MPPRVSVSVVVLLAEPTPIPSGSHFRVGLHIIAPCPPVTETRYLPPDGSHELIVRTRCSCSTIYVPGEYLTRCDFRGARFGAKPIRVQIRNRVPLGKPIRVQPPRQPDRVRLRERARVRIVVPVPHVCKAARILLPVHQAPEEVRLRGALGVEGAELRPDDQARAVAAGRRLPFRRRRRQDTGWTCWSYFMRPSHLPFMSPPCFYRPCRFSIARSAF